MTTARERGRRGGEAAAGMGRPLQRSLTASRCLQTLWGRSVCCTRALATRVCFCTPFLSALPLTHSNSSSNKREAMSQRPLLSATPLLRFTPLTFPSAPSRPLPSTRSAGSWLPCQTSSDCTLRATPSLYLFASPLHRRRHWEEMGTQQVAERRKTRIPTLHLQRVHHRLLRCRQRPPRSMPFERAIGRRRQLLMPF